MATALEDRPPASRTSSSELSDPPESSDNVLGEIVVKMAPVTRQRSQFALADDQPKVNGDKAAPKKPVGNIATTRNGDEVEAVIHVSPRTTRRKVSRKRGQLPSSKPTASRQPAAKRPKTNTKKWEPDYVTQSSKSPLVGRDLRALLLHPQAWDLLAEEDRKEILALFPDDKHIADAGSPSARPNVLSLQNDDNFRHDTEEYVSNLSKDMHDPLWLEDAWAAHGCRASGDFDRYYICRVEADWKTTIPDDLKPEHLRSAPRPKASSVDHHPAETGTNGAADMEDSASSNEDGASSNDNVKAEPIIVDLSKSDTENEFHENVVNSTEKVSGDEGNETDDTHDTDNDDFDKMHIGPG